MKHQLSAWRKSTRSSGSQDCVEVGFGPEALGIRDTKDRTGGTLVLTSTQASAFLAAVKNSRFSN